MEALAEKEGWQGDFAKLCQSERLKIVIRKQMEKADRVLAPQERVEGDIFLEANEWSEKDLLTPTLKLKRLLARSHYKLELERLFAL